MTPTTGADDVPPADPDADDRDPALDTDSFRTHWVRGSGDSAEDTGSHVWGAVQTGAHEIVTDLLDEPVPPLLTALSAGGVVAVVAAFLPWGYAHLLDTGTVLLTSTSTGRDSRYPGTWVIGLGVLVVLLGVTLIWRPVWRALAGVAAAAGLAIAVLAVTSRHDNAPRVEHLRHIRPGTFQYNHLSAEGVVGYGLWIAVAAGVVTAAAALAWLATAGRRR